MISAFELLQSGLPITEVLRLLNMGRPDDIQDFLMAFEDYFRIQLTEKDVAYLKINVPLLKQNLDAYAKEGRKFCPFFVDLLYDEDAHTRGSASLALGRNNYVKAVPNLIELLYDKNSSVVESAISALDLLNEMYRDTSGWGTIKDSLILAFTSLFHSENPEIRGLAVEALGDMGPRAYGALPKLHAVLNDSLEIASIKERAKEAIGRILPKREDY